MDSLKEGFGTGFEGTICVYTQNGILKSFMLKIDR